MVLVRDLEASLRFCQYRLRLDLGEHRVVAILRAEAGHDPYDRRLSDLIGELSTRSDAFRVRWAAHNVKFHRTGAKRLHHPVVGDLTLDYEAFELPADPGQRMNIYTAEPSSPSHQALNLLASWGVDSERSDQHQSRRQHGRGATRQRWRRRRRLPGLSVMTAPLTAKLAAPERRHAVPTLWVIKPLSKTRTTAGKAG